MAGVDDYLARYYKRRSRILQTLERYRRGVYQCGSVRRSWVMSTVCVHVLPYPLLIVAVARFAIREFIVSRNVF
jgi:hypothetical protein